MEPEQIRANIARWQQRLQEASGHFGGVEICAVTKTHAAAEVNCAADAGIRTIGENRVQELMGKIDGLDPRFRTHLIGQLQTNKVRQVVGRVSLIQSVDRTELLECIEREAGRQGVVQDILLEINVAAEESKSGFAPEQAPEIAARMGEFPHCRLRGLMAIPPISEHSGDNCRYFEKIRTIAVDITAKKYDNVRMDCLSMGMSEDFTDAIACGSTMIRVGTAIFGARNYTK